VNNKRLRNSGIRIIFEKLLITVDHLFGPWIYAITSTLPPAASIFWRADSEKRCACTVNG
jgi:hypothetical protein